MAQIPQLGASLLGLKFSNQFQEREENHVFFLLAPWLVLLAAPQDGPAQGRRRLHSQALLPAGLLTARARFSREYGLHSEWQCPKRRQERMQPPHRRPLQHHSSWLPFLARSLCDECLCRHTGSSHSMDEPKLCTRSGACGQVWNPGCACVPVFASMLGQSPALCSPPREAN